MKVDTKKYAMGICILLLLFLFNSVQAQQKITGRIVDGDNAPLAGASVLVKGTHIGTTADADGRFSLVLPKANAVLIINSIGFEKREIKVTGNTVPEIKMLASNSVLGSVVVTGYSRQSKRDVTGAASTVSATDIAQTPVSDITTALQGRVAGVSVDDQGGPGNSAVVRIRGIGTLGNNDPLYVIDGVQIRIGGATSLGSQNIGNLINTNDIETLTILKDPSLTSLYGAEGANGVIVITTKSGKKGDPRFEYNSYVSDQFPMAFPKMLTPQQQANALYNSYTNTNQAFPYGSFYGTGTSPILPDYIIEGSSSNLGVSASSPAANPSLYNFNNYRILQANKAGTNWWATLFQPALSQNHQISISGATDKLNYAMTLGYLDDNGIMLNSYFKRLSLRINTEYKIKPWFRIGENMEMSYTTGNAGPSRGFNNDIAAIYGLSPLLPTHDIEGNLSGTNTAPILGGTNPEIDRADAVNSKNYTESIIGSSFAELEPIKGLTFQSKIGYQLVPNQYHTLSDTFPQQAIPIHTQYYTEGNSMYSDWRWTNKLAYSTTINHDHRITAFAAYEAREQQSRWSNIVETNLIGSASNYQYVSAGTFNNNFLPSGSGSRITSISEIGNITYSFMDKYYATGTIRHDGSSVFGTDNKYGTFPAFSAGWRISGEKFMQGIDWLSDLKIRGSWGKTGNDAINGNAQFSLINSTDPIYGGYDITGSNISQVQGAYPSQIGNPNLQWEANTTTNIGLDASMFQNRLSANLNWFDRKTNKLLYTPPFSGTGGSASAPVENVMSFSNKGLELELGYHGGNNNGFHYEVNFNISSYKSRIDYIDGDSTSYINGATYAPTHFNLTRNVVGHPVSEFYGYMQTGIFQSAADFTSANVSYPNITSANATGHFKFKDLNNDGVINSSDQTFLGNPNPKFSYGLNLNFMYKNFDLGIFLQGVYGNKIFNYWRAYSEFPGMLGAGSFNTWSSTNTGAKLPMYTEDGVNGNEDALPSSFFIENGSYLRVKTLQLGYTFHRNKAYSRLRVYIQGFNLFTITKYTGMDPEVNSGDPSSLGIDYGTQYPISRKILFGINLGL